MLTKSDRLQTISRIILLLVFCIPFVLMFTPFFYSILIAAFVALGIEPILQKIGTRTKRKKYFGAALFLTLVVFIFVPMTLFFARVVKTLKTFTPEFMENSQFLHALFDVWEAIQNQIKSIADLLGIDPQVLPSKQDLISGLGPVLIENAKLFLSSLPHLALSLFVFFSMLVLLTTRAGLIKKLFVDLKLLPEEEIEQITQSLKSSCYLILVSILLIGTLQALIVSMGSLIFGYHEFFLIFTFTLFFSFIPIIGAAPVAVLLSIISFLNGNPFSGVGMGIVAIVAGTIDNILKPYIFSSESKNLHPLVSLFGIIGAISVFGIPGLIIGPLIMQVTLKIGPELVRKLMLPQSKAEDTF